MGWKLRKDKLREGQTDGAPAADEQAAQTEESAAATGETAGPADVSLNPLPHEAEAAPALDAPHDLNGAAFAPLPTLASEDAPQSSHALADVAPEAVALPLGTDAETDADPAHDPLNFAPASDLDTLIENLGSGEDDAPVFGLDSVFVPGTDTDDAEFMPTANDDTSAFAPTPEDDALGFDPLSSAFDPLPDDAADAIALPLSGPAPIVLGEDAGPLPIALGKDAEPLPIALGEDAGPLPIALGEDAGGALGAFVPYQPQTADAASDAADPAFAVEDDAYSDPDLEIGAMAFNPQSPSFGTFDPQAPTAGEEIAQETPAPAFADTADTSPVSFADTLEPSPASFADPAATAPMAFGNAPDNAPLAFGAAPGEAAMSFEPSFEAPDALAGATPSPEYVDPSAPFLDSESLAPGLVSMEASTGLPRVAPFVLAGGDNPDYGDDSSGPHSLVLRLGTLSATFPLVKTVTTIGRPDQDTATYPDVEVDLDDGVSRRHAEVRQEGDAFYIVDVGSTNGTILNGELLAPNKPASLMRGDRIRIGERVEITFE